MDARGAVNDATADAVDAGAAVRAGSLAPRRSSARAEPCCPRQRRSLPRPATAAATPACGCNRTYCRTYSLEDNSTYLFYLFYIYEWAFTQVPSCGLVAVNCSATSFGRGSYRAFLKSSDSLRNVSNHLDYVTLILWWTPRLSDPFIWTDECLLR